MKHLSEYERKKIVKLVREVKNSLEKIHGVNTHEHDLMVSINTKLGMAIYYLTL